ncbi:testis-specific serine/threonine-protein kinase 6 [Symphorus nematophorus]
MNDKFMESQGYMFRSCLGEGKFGKVVCAYSTLLKRNVAIKIVDKKKVSFKYTEKFLSREVAIIKSLKHPNVINTHDIFESNTSKVYVVMEFCVKGDLLQHITAKGPLSGHSSCRLFIQLCKAVQYLHNTDVAHRDLKCENLLLDVNHNLKVCDFSFSKRLKYVDGRLVLSNTYCGTSSYAAPEVLRNVLYNPKVSDVWSMGVVLYRMLYAALPFDPSNIMRLVQMQMQHRINFPGTPSVSLEAKDLIQSILHPDVAQRITICKILKNTWVLQRGRMEDSHEPTKSTTASGKEGPQDKQDKQDEKPSKDDSDPGEGPSAAAPRH